MTDQVECNCAWNPDSHAETCPVYMQQQIHALRQHKTDYMESAEATRRALEADIARLKGMLGAAQDHAVSAQHHALDMGQRALRAALHSCAKASSAAEVGLIVDEALAAQVNRIPALDEHLRYILGRPNFWCHHLANALRAMGHEIARKAEEEQAAVIHWLLNAYFEHGPGWREAVEKILAAEREKELAKGGESPTCDSAQVSKVAEKAGQ